jgi:hypothetical protein
MGIIVTGHSLGGSLASYASSKAHVDGITFNAAGLHPLVGNSKNAHIKAFYIRGDILSFGQDLIPFLPGAAGQRYHTNPTIIRDPITYHFSRTIKNIWN